MLAVMTNSHVPARTVTPRSKLTGINPRNFSRTSWWRFSRDRRVRYVSRLLGAPSDMQAALIENMISLEWAAHQAEAEGGLVGLREGREHRRLFQKLLEDFQASLQPAPPSPSRPRQAPRPGPPQLSLEEHLDLLRQRQGGAA